MVELTRRLWRWIERKTKMQGILEFYNDKFYHQVLFKRQRKTATKSNLSIKIALKFIKCYDCISSVVRE